jgi:glycosyltransferase involved in cell wall biosynthesis
VAVVRNLQQQMEGIRLVVLSRNFGPHYAILAAVNSIGPTDYLTVMSADMQEPVTLYRDLFDKCMSTGCDIALADRLNRSTDAINRFFSRLYNKMVQKFAIAGYPSKGLDIFMISTKIIAQLKNRQFKNTSLHALVFNMGFTREYVPYRQQARQFGTTKWSFTNKIKLLLDTFVSFSVVPLKLITILGFLFSGLGFAYGITIIVMWFFKNITVQGWATLVALNLFGFGLVFLMIGIISEYIWRIYDQLNPREMYIIKDKFGFDDESAQ